MTEESVLLGRVLRASTTTFVAGCPRPIIEEGQTPPEFGALVKAVRHNGDIIYGLIYDVAIQDDALVRQLVAAAVEAPEILADQRQRRQVPIEVSVLAVGHGRALDVHYRLPPQPPGALDEILICNAAEIVRFTGGHEWLRSVLTAPDAPVDHLIATALLRAAAARPPGDSDAYLISAGRELARLLSVDVVRLEGILRLLRD